MRRVVCCGSFISFNVLYVMYLLIYNSLIIETSEAVLIINLKAFSIYSALFMPDCGLETPD